MAIDVVRVEIAEAKLIQGPTGETGKSAYAAAVEKGYTGTEDEFAIYQANIVGGAEAAKGSAKKAEQRATEAAKSAEEAKVLVEMDFSTKTEAQGYASTAKAEAIAEAAADATTKSNAAETNAKNAANVALAKKADLVNGVVPANQLPAYVDDVLEFDSRAAFPAVGESGKIYVAMESNKTYRWSGTTYVEISASLALGETASAAYRGDRGKIAYEHTLNTENPHGVTPAQIGAETPSGAQGKADKAKSDATETAKAYTDDEISKLEYDPVGSAEVVNQKIVSHCLDMGNPHGITAEQLGAAEKTLANVPDADFKAKAVSAGVGGDPSVYDVVIRTQAEFETLIASPTWMGAVSVCFIGDGGTLKFISSGMNREIRIPKTVKQIRGFNNTIIEIPTCGTFVFGYSALPTGDDYWIKGITIKANFRADTYRDKCRGISNCKQLVNCHMVLSADNAWRPNSAIPVVGFFSCNQLINCTSSVVGLTPVVGSVVAFAFQGCNQLINCSGEAISNGLAENNVNAYGEAAGFASCVLLLNCTGIGKGIFTTPSGFNGDPTGKGYGFYHCTQLVNCSGSGTGEAAEAKRRFGYGFNSCNYLNSCKQGAAVSTTAFLGGTNTKVDTLTVVAS